MNKSTLPYKFKMSVNSLKRVKLFWKIYYVTNMLKYWKIV